MRAMNRRAFLALSLGSSIAALSGCRSARASAATQPAGPAAPAVTRDPGPGTVREAASGRSVQEIAVGGAMRRYVRFEPPGLDPAASVPLVLVLHGRGGNGTIAERLYEMSDLAAVYGFVVAYPDALGDPPTWHAGLGTGGGQQDDVDFVRALVEREASTRPLDQARIFACGHSSGAMMSYRLAAEASDLFPAVGIVAGAVGVRGPNGRTLTIPNPDRPVSVIHFHGTDDPLVPYDGGSQRGPAGFVSVADSIDFWVTANGCNPTPATETVGVARRETYTGGRDGTEVTLWTVEGGGHGWPKMTGRSSVAVAPSGISATELTWAFFAAHPRGAVSRTS
jgi:polyhydroxybutyrate depolymerase